MNLLNMQTNSVIRGVSSCRGCEGTKLFSILDLGLQPIANELLETETSEEHLFPLELSVCSDCGLGQIGEFVSPARIFSDSYPYLSSVSGYWLSHAKNYYRKITTQFQLNKDHFIVELASNDGYLLQYFNTDGYKVLGVEPADNVANIARGLGIETLSSFFGRSIAKEIKETYGNPRLLIANNVLAHVPDLDDFVGGISLLCDDKTIVTIENPSFTNLLMFNQFDTIYHEHFSYLSAHAVSILMKRHGLELFDVEKLEAHGGSYRYYVRKGSSELISNNVNSAIAEEIGVGLLSPELWGSFSVKSRQAISGLKQWIFDRKLLGSRIVAYGAAAKGNTLLNAAGVKSGDILFVIDGSKEKQGKFLPGSRIPILDLESTQNENPTDILVLPWNIANEITRIAKQHFPEALCWIAIPEMKIYES